MEDNLKQKTAKGLFWSSVQNFSVRGIEFLLMLFMARLLGPKEYGTIGLLGVFMALSHLFINSGFGSGLIRKKDRTHEDLCTVYFFNIVMSIACYLVLFIIAPYVADFYNIPVLSPILRVIGITLIIGAFNTVQVAVFNYTMNFRIQARISIVQFLIGGLSGLGLALLGYGVWALAWQRVITSIVACIMCWTYATWKPSWIFSIKSFKELFNYGYKLVITGLINTLYNNVYPVIVGKFFSADILGHSSRANHWASFPSSNLTIILNNVTFASLAKIQDDDVRLGRAYRKMIRTAAFVIFPAMFGLSAVAVPLMLVVLGPKWGLCAQILTIISFTYMLSPIHSLNGNLILVKGRSDIALKLSIIQKIIGLTLMLTAAFYFGVMAIFYAGLIGSILMLFMNTYYTGKFINVGFWRQMKDITPTFILCVIMFIAVKITMAVIPNIYIQLVVSILVGAGVYVGLAYLFKFEELGEVWSMYKEMRKQRKK